MILHIAAIGDYHDDGERHRDEATEGGKESHPSPIPDLR
jgi:hypothetical protein